MTTREVIQAMSREQLESAFTQREEQLAKYLSADNDLANELDMQKAYNEDLIKECDQLKDQLAKALEAEKLARAGFDKAALDRESERNKVKLLAMGQETFLKQIESIKAELTAHTQALKVAKALLEAECFSVTEGDALLDTINNLLK